MARTGIEYPAVSAENHFADIRTSRPENFRNASRPVAYSSTRCEVTGLHARFAGEISGRTLRARKSPNGRSLVHHMSGKLGGGARPGPVQGGVVPSVPALAPTNRVTPIGLLKQSEPTLSRAYRPLRVIIARHPRFPVCVIVQDRFMCYRACSEPAGRFRRPPEGRSWNSAMALYLKLFDLPCIDKYRGTSDRPFSRRFARKV